jgi:hypothetical protein
VFGKSTASEVDTNKSDVKVKVSGYLKQVKAPETLEESGFFPGEEKKVEEV